MSNIYLVTLWKFDRYSYTGKEIVLKYNPAYIDKGKPSIWNLVKQTWKEWKSK